LLFVSLVMGSAALLAAGLLFFLKERAAGKSASGMPESPVANEHSQKASAAT